MVEIVYTCSFGRSVKENIMNTINSNRSINKSTLVLCAAVFIVFAFVFLYWYQADLLTVTQHTLSKGKTHYNHMVGAVVIVTVLQMLQVGVSKLCDTKVHIKALTYLPSFLILTALTSASVSQTGVITFGFWVVGLPVLLLITGLLLWGISAANPVLPMMSACREAWINILMLLMMMLMTCGFSNSDRVCHARLHMEQCLLDSDYEQALSAAKSVCVPDENVSMLTAYALSRKKQLGEKLFEYPLKGGAGALIPDGVHINFCMYPESKFFGYLGGWYVQRMSSGKYFDYQRRHGKLNKAAIDYMLCGYLLDKKLDAFANALPLYYAINDSLPKHYKEALVLYVHKRANPRLLYENNVMNADFQDYQKIERQTNDKRERQNLLHDTYGNTYWYYYQY